MQQKFEMSAQSSPSECKHTTEWMKRKGVVGGMRNERRRVEDRSKGLYVNGCRRDRGQPTVEVISSTNKTPADRAIRDRHITSHAIFFLRNLLASVLSHITSADANCVCKILCQKIHCKGTVNYVWEKRCKRTKDRIKSL